MAVTKSGECCPRGHDELKRRPDGTVHCRTCELDWTGVVTRDEVRRGVPAAELAVEPIIPEDAVVLKPVTRSNSVDFHLAEPGAAAETRCTNNHDLRVDPVERSALGDEAVVCTPCAFGRTGGTKEPSYAHKLRAADDPERALQQERGEL